MAISSNPKRVRQSNRISPEVIEENLDFIQEINTGCSFSNNIRNFLHSSCELILNH